MSILIDSVRGKAVAEHLYRLFSTVGIRGSSKMPEDDPPYGVNRGTLEHLLFITLTVAIDYQRKAPQLWEASRKSFADPETRYLFNPGSLAQTTPKKVVKDMKRYGLSRKPKKDACIWRTVGITFYKKWDGDPRNFLESCGWDSLGILQRLKDDCYIYNNRSVHDFPCLRGPKIGPLWLRMLRDNVGFSQLRSLEKVPIPVDIHVARATLTTGVVRGSVKIKMSDLFEYIRRAWFESTDGLYFNDRPLIALDIDKPLWHLSKYGCTRRAPLTSDCPLHGSCEATNFCVKGKIKIDNNHVTLDT